ncbi:hypothetical protein HanOQP8_Chr00c649g0846621 [Helianthus annuus]|nr:hypothetical protein HanOQP8_Chr00c649g0846621 [Helianthus annuus]
MAFYSYYIMNNTLMIVLLVIKKKRFIISSAAISEAETALSSYNSFYNNNSSAQKIWAVAENYRFEPAFVESRKLVSEIGDMMSVQVLIEGSMNSSNPYFSSSWRRNFTVRR